jgi:hypothetical protein
LDVGPVERCKVYYKEEGGGFAHVRAVMSLVCPCCPWFVLAPKVLQLCINHLALVLCKERAPTPYSSVVFCLGLTFESLKELGVHQKTCYETSYKLGKKQKVEEFKVKYMVKRFSLIMYLFMNSLEFPRRE